MDRTDTHKILIAGSWVLFIFLLWDSNNIPEMVNY